MTAWTLVFHLVGLVFWLGSLLVVTTVLAAHTEESDSSVRAALARLEIRLLNRLAHVGAAIVLITGIILIYTNPAYYLHAPWLHAKLSLVAILIGLNFIVYLSAKALQAGEIRLRRGECMALHGAIALMLLAILILALIKPFDRRASRAQDSRFGLPSSQTKTQSSAANPDF